MGAALGGWSGRTALRGDVCAGTLRPCSGVYSVSLAFSLKLMDIVWATGRDGGL